MFKPVHRLQEGLLLGEYDFRVGRVSSHGKTVLNTTEKVNLVLLSNLLQHLLGLMALGRGEDDIGFYRKSVSKLPRSWNWEHSQAYPQQRCSGAL